jgi:hypothetical protein
MKQVLKDVCVFVGVAGAVVGVWVVVEVFYEGTLYYSSAKQKMATTTPDHLATTASTAAAPTPWPKSLDRSGYNKRLLSLVDQTALLDSLSLATGTLHATSSGVTPLASSTATTSPLVYATNTNVTVRGERWPAPAPYPHGEAILPFERIVAYYGNFYSRRMGILGEHDRATVLAQLASTSAAWEAADPDTPVRPAIHYIAMVAQGDAGADGMYRNVMPAEHIERAHDMAQGIDGIMFLDLQVGLSTLQRELPQFREYFTRPDVHLGIDPEFSMKRGNPPGTVIGTFDAADINFAINWLSEIVREHELPPKVLVVHRFTQNMVTNYQEIEPTPEVQVVMHMDGWGPRDLKRGTYRNFIEPEPVQFTGLKIFYKNDRKPPSTGIFSPTEALELHPEPVYIQYQ